jgi:hypothetical protein
MKQPGEVVSPLSGASEGRREKRRVVYVELVDSMIFFRSAWKALLRFLYADFHDSILPDLLLHLPCSS